MPISRRRIVTSRLTVGIAEHAPSAGLPVTHRVMLVHGNVSSSRFWESTIDALSEALPGVHAVAPDLRGFGESDPLPVDARRGVRDFSEDLEALIEALGWHSPAETQEGTGVDVLGWSLGGGVVMQLLRDHPALVRSLTLVAPVSPYGFGGTHGTAGELNHPDGAGSGAGGANPEFVQRLADRDAGAGSPLSPLSVLQAFYVASPLPEDAAELPALVEAMLSTRTGAGHYPGDSVDSPAWPGFGPGDHGVLNAIAPTHFRIDDLHTIAGPTDRTAASTLPPILWVRGDQDRIVSDASLFDMAQLGALGAVPGWPGAAECPAQPMVAQTRHALQQYADAGGRYRELVLPETGHSPQLERPKEFLAALLDQLTAPTDKD